MAYSIKGTTILMTRGDTFSCEFPIFVDGEPYELCPCDTVRFAAKKDWDDAEPAIYKELKGYLLVLDSDDTKNLDFGHYKYDVQIEIGTGEVITYIPKGMLVIDKEVH